MRPQNPLNIIRNLQFSIDFILAEIIWRKYSTWVVPNTHLLSLAYNLCNVIVLFGAISWFEQYAWSVMNFPLPIRLHLNKISSNDDKLGVFEIWKWNELDDVFLIGLWSEVGRNFNWPPENQVNWPENNGFDLS